MIDTDFIGYQFSGNICIELIRDGSENDPFSGMVISAACKLPNKKIPVICPLLIEDHRTYILLNAEVFKNNGSVKLSLSGISDEKVVITSNMLELKVDASNDVQMGITPSEEYWEIEVSNAMKVWYANVVDPVFHESEIKLNQLIRRSEEQEEKTEAIISDAELAISNTNVAKANANYAANRANEATTKANNIASEVERKLNAGEFVGEKGDTGESGITTPINSMYTLSVDADGDLYVNYNDSDTPPSFVYDSETGNLYYEI